MPLPITIKSGEFFDEAAQEFRYTKETTFQLEHSLLSISKWEKKWHVQFIGNESMTQEMIKDYIKCMCISANANLELLDLLTEDQFQEIKDYIADSQSATGKLKDIQSDKKNSDPPTSEFIYSWMIELKIPMEAEKWHINRLLKLIHILALDNQPEKHMTQAQINAHHRAVNAARRAQHIHH